MGSAATNALWLVVWILSGRGEDWSNAILPGMVSQVCQFVLVLLLCYFLHWNLLVTVTMEGASICPFLIFVVVYFVCLWMNALPYGKCYRSPSLLLSLLMPALRSNYWSHGGFPFYCRARIAKAMFDWSLLAGDINGGILTLFDWSWNDKIRLGSCRANNKFHMSESLGWPYCVVWQDPHDQILLRVQLCYWLCGCSLCLKGMDIIGDDR